VTYPGKVTSWIKVNSIWSRSRRHKRTN